MVDVNSAKSISQDLLSSYCVSSCMEGNLDAVKYLLTSPELEKHADIYFNGNAAFASLIFKEHIEIIHYLIFDFGIEKTSEITDLLINEKNEFISEIKDMFDVRDFNDKLEKGLSSAKVNQKKLKL